VEQAATFDLPATADEVLMWVQDLPFNALITATVYSTFKKASGQARVMRITAHWETHDNLAGGAGEVVD
jgi:hypothetical protein